MTWNKAEDLVETLKSQGKSETEIIEWLKTTTDRYRSYHGTFSEQNARLRQSVVDLRIKYKELIPVEVNEILFDIWGRAYIYWRTEHYKYNGSYFERDHTPTFKTHETETIEWKFTVIVEPATYHRTLETTGQIVGSLHGKQLVEIEHVHGFSRGDKVYIRQENK